MAKFREAKQSTVAGSKATTRSDARIADQVRDLKTLLAELGRLRPLRDPIAAIGPDLTPPQLHSVLWLGADGALPASVLSHRVGCGQPTITGVIDRLEKLGLVERERDTGDRRVVRAKLTAAGRDLYVLLEGRVTEKLTLMLSAVDDADRAHIVRILEKLVDRFRARKETA